MASPGADAASGEPAARVRYAVDPTIDLLGLIDMLLRRKWLILSTTVLVVALAFAALLFIPKKYSGVARLLVDPRAQRVIQNELVQPGLGADLVLVDSQVEIITSEAVLSRVVANENLTNDPEFIGTVASTRPPAELALENLAKATAVARAEKTYVLEITVTTKQPAKSARLANAVVAAYLEDQSASTASAARQVSSSIQDRLSELQQRLRQAERKVEDYKLANNVATPEGRLLVERQLTDLSSRLSVAVAAATEAKSRLDVIEAAVRNRGDASSSASESENSTMIQLRGQLGEAQRRLAELSQVLGPRHPRVSAAEAEVAQTRETMRVESQRLLAAARDTYRTAADTEAAVRADLEQLTAKSFDMNKSLIQLRELEREAQSSRVVYETFLVRAKETAEQENLGAATARVIAPASVPDRPSFPPRMLLLMASGVLGLFLGLLLAILRDLFSADSMLRRAPPETAVPAVAAPIETAPAMPDVRLTVVTAVADVALSKKVALELGRSAARAGSSSLLLDLSPDRQRTTPGLADLVVGLATPADVIHSEPSSGLDLLHAGLEETVARADEEDVALIVDALARDYDRIVVNIGPLYGDAEAIADVVLSRAEHAVLAVEAEMSPADHQAFEELTASGALGVSVVSVDRSEPLDQAA